MTVWVCLLSFPHYFCRSCAIFFCHVYWVMFVFYSVRHVWAFGLALLFFLSLRGMRIVQIRASSHVAHWVPILAISLLFHGPVGHVGPLGSLALSSVFPDPLVSSLPLILPMGQLAIIPAMLAHWTCYLFSWASSAHLLHLYVSFFP